jgi:hypothetical protein
MELLTIYQTRTMLEAIRKYPAAPSFLKDTFFPRRQTVPTENVDVDFKRGKRLMAPYVDQYNPSGLIVERAQWTPLSFNAPLLSPARALTAVEAGSHRNQGEDIYSQKTPADRANELLSEDMLELDQMITRSEELQAAQLLFTGAINLYFQTGDNDVTPSTQVLNYCTPLFVQIGGGSATSGYGPDWGSSPSTATPIADLDAMSRYVLQRGYVKPNILITTSAVYDAFINSVDAERAFFPDRLDLGTFAPVAGLDHVDYVGRLRKPNVMWFTYDNWTILPGSSSETQLVPPGYGILGNTNTMSKIVYGAVTQLEGEGAGTFRTYEGVRVPKVYGDLHKERRYLKLSARPLCVPDDALSWITFNINSVAS